MALLWILLGAALVVITAIFHSMNPVAVDVNLFGYPIFGVPLWMLVAIPAVAGLAIGILMDLPDRVRAVWRHRRLTGHVRDRDRAIAELRQRVIDLERDLTAARAAYSAAEASQTPVVIEETHKVPATGTVTETRTELPRAA
jgi:uncharacterized integral membrane protein